MKQAASITRSADRHAQDHGRDFAETETFTVEAGTLRDVLDRVLADSAFAEERGRFVIIVDWPYDA